MPMIDHLAEAGVVIHDEFREDNIAPASRNLEFIQMRPPCLRSIVSLMFVSIRLATMQTSSTTMRKLTKPLPIGGRLDAPTLKAIEAISESDSRHYADCAIAETTHSMNGTSKAFRLIIVKHKHQAGLFDD